MSEMERRGWQHAANLKRKALTEWYGYECQRCHKTSDRSADFVCHHRHYRTLGVEAKEDVTILCQDCHQDLHRRSKARELAEADIPFVDPFWEPQIRERDRAKKLQVVTDARNEKFREFFESRVREGEAYEEAKQRIGAMREYKMLELEYRRAIVAQADGGGFFFSDYGDTILLREDNAARVAELERELGL